jgi:ribosomal protein S18 acetylase RimI-like enzyme
MGYTIRPAAADEYHDLNRIKLDASLMIGPHYARPMNREVFLRCVPRGEVVVICEDDSIRGYSVAYNEDDDLYLRNLFVASAYTHNGLGTQLLKQVIDRAQNTGRRAITLITGLSAPWNAPYYHRHGFKIITESLPDYLQHSLDAERASFGAGTVSPPESPYLLPRVAMVRLLK